jgi:REP element-mobilizing transposase RayT
VGRPHRLQASGEHFHVTARGVRREPVFSDDLDFALYLRLLSQTAERYAWIVLAYCLMPNHIHLVVRLTAPTLSVGMQRQQGLYARKFNERHALTGHVFEGRFHASRLESEAHLLGAVRYVARNPAEAGLCADPAEWRWSSHRAVAGPPHRGSPVDVHEARALFGSDERTATRYLGFVGESRAGAR